MKFFTVLLLFLLAVPYLQAEVYLLGPPRRTGSKYLPAPSELTGNSSKPLYSTPVEVNGTPLTLEVYRIKSTLSAIARLLRTRYPQAQITGGKDFLRATFTDERKRKEHWLFTAAGAVGGVTAFRLPLREKPGRPQWYRELPPLPPDTRPELTVKLPALNGIFASFAGGTAQDPARRLAAYSDTLRAGNWQSAGAESAPSIRGRGEIFIRMKPVQEVLWMNFSADGSGMFYHKTILNSK